MLRSCIEDLNVASSTSCRAYNEALLLRGGPSPRINRGLGDVDLSQTPPVYTGPSLMKHATKDKLVASINQVSDVHVATSK